MNVLAEVSDTVQIVTLITGTITAICLPYIGYLMARLKANSEEAKIKADEAAIKVEQVRRTAAVAATAVEKVATTLQTQQESTDEKLKGLADQGAATHDLVNGGLSPLMKIAAEATNFKAETTGKASDRALADASRDVYENHLRQQKPIP